MVFWGPCQEPWSTKFNKVGGCQLVQFLSSEEGQAHIGFEATFYTFPVISAGVLDCVAEKPSTSSHTLKLEQLLCQYKGAQVEPSYFPSGPGTKELGQPHAPLGLLHSLGGAGRGDAGRERLPLSLVLDSICPFTKNSLGILTLHQLLSSREERDGKDKVSVLGELQVGN